MTISDLRADCERLNDVKSRKVIELIDSYAKSDLERIAAVAQVVEYQAEIVRLDDSIRRERITAVAQLGAYHAEIVRLGDRVRELEEVAADARRQQWKKYGYLLTPAQLRLAEELVSRGMDESRACRLASLDKETK